MHKQLHAYSRLALVAALLFGGTLSYGQGNSNPEKTKKKEVPQAALEHIKKHKQKLDVTDDDIADLELSSETESKKSGMRHLYVKQMHHGIEVFGSLTNVSVSKDGTVVAMGNRFHKEVGKKVKGEQAQLDAEAAVRAAAKYLNTPLQESLNVLESSGELNREVTFSKGGISLEPITAKLVYQPMEDGSLVLAWEVSIYELDAQNWWNLRLDANTGNVLDKDNMVVKCMFENDGPGGQPLHTEHSHTALSPFIASATAQPATMVAANGYGVFPMPSESPTHGPRAFVSNTVADATASPNGWHIETRTRGSNVFAYEDPNNSNSYLTNYSTDGGPDLLFDFTPDFTQQPVTYRDAAITNLFYWNNLIHDVWYKYGFDELSGSFQLNNYGRGGAQGDPVLAEAQDSRNILATRNNANFSTPRDGFAPRMQMYLWSSIPDPEAFKINTPSTIAGFYQIAGASFGPKLTPTPLTGKLVLAASGVNSDGCNAFSNAEAISGNIAVVYRGSCPFVDKVQNAQAAGAIAVIVININPGAPTSMGGTPTQTITIPSVMVSNETGASIRQQLDMNTEVTISLKDKGNPELDGDFDNGIIAHEYGHGISNRLTGGPNVTNCLTNAEQMGEGWSDWFGLMMTIKPGDKSDKIRGIGTYASGQPTTGLGIRPAPYSTDMGINPYTYAATNNPAISQPHGIGFVWSTMLWDMTWAMVDEYGYDADLYNGTGGNNMAMQLVIDGLKLQPCRPGFVDGRDAILLADRINNNGANQELIWRVFARRGLGFSATQGLSTSRADQAEAFDVPPVFACSAPVIAVTPSSTVFTGGDAKTIYLGYGPQSVTLAASGDPTFRYTWAAQEELSNTAIANPVFTPTKAGTYTLVVTAVNEDECTRTASVTIRVVDVREIKNNSVNIYICHNGNTNVVAKSAVEAHLAHGDKLGDCNMSATAQATAVAASELEHDLSGSFVSSYPNPFSESTNIRFTAKESGQTQLKVYDMTGREVATLFNGNAERGVTYTKSFKATNKQAAGLYIYRLVNGGTMKSGTMLLVK